MPRPDMPFRQIERQKWLLLAVLGVALVLRLATIRFGLPALNDPDEMMFELGALRMLRGPTLNPGWFGHPATTTMYLLAVTNLLAFAAAWLSGSAATVPQFVDLVYHDPSWMILPGRIVTTLFAIASIHLTWRIGARLFGPAAGLAAAALLAVNPVHIAWSVVIRSDMMACVFMLLCLRSSIMIAERGSWRAYLGAALWLGLAVATKWPFALSGLAIAAATLVAVRARRLDARDAIIRLVAAGVAAIGVLLVVSPFLVLDYPTLVRNLQGEGQARHLGATGGGFWHNLRWYAAGPVFAGFGPIGIACILAGVPRLFRDRLALAILAPVACAFVILLCAQSLLWERWALPLMPIGAIVAAGGLTGIAARLRPQGKPLAGPWIVAAVLALAIVSLVPRIRTDHLTRMNDTRQMASVWARAHVPTGSVVLIEHFAFDLVREPWRFVFPMGDAGCIDVRGFLAGKTGYAAIERARAGRSNLDYGTVAARMRATCHADFAILTQADRYAHEAADFPRENEAYADLRSRAPSAATFVPEPGVSGGPVVTILDLRR